MAGKVVFSVSMSLDGFIAPESVEELLGQQWMELQQWIFRENLRVGEGGEERRDNDIVRETYLRTGASVMGKRMFDAGERMWPEEAPFHTPVFVLDARVRLPAPRVHVQAGQRCDSRCRPPAMLFLGCPAHQRSGPTFSQAAGQP
jgi:hypothetical protein